MTIMSCYSSLVFVLLCLFNLSFSEAVNGGFSVDIIHRDSPKSPFYRSTESHFQRVSNAVTRSINRVNHFKQSLVSPNTLQAPVIPDLGEYLMSFSIGTPPLQVFGIVDTGSDIIWLQCQPCRPCYNQTSPIFDPSKSKTYKNIICFSKKCRSVVGTSCSPDFTNRCKYTINFVDGSHSRGDLSEETLTFASTNGSPIKLPRTVIGCGHDNDINAKGKNSGVVGLGHGTASLINQLGSSVGWKFSYCLVPTLSQCVSSSKLNFGDAAVVSGNGVVSTPLFSRNDAFYYLNLEAFSVGSSRIEFGKPGGKGNTVIDSGTTLTILPDDVYSRLESAVAKEVKYQRTKDPAQVLSLCYKAKSDKLDVPVITAHFTGGDVLLHPITTFIPVADGVVCFAFMPTQTDAVFGNLAQQNLLVGYDLQKNTVSFKNTDCTKQ